jgi:hypothetical protein
LTRLYNKYPFFYFIGIQFRKMPKKILSLIFLFFLSNFLSAQSEIPIGVWKSHLAYKEGFWVAESENSIFYAASKGLLIINKEDNSTRFLSKEDGLSDVNISRLIFDKSNGQLIIVYTDSNIDILSDNDEVINIPSIKDNRTIIGSKSIYDFQIVDERVAYLATNFGILSFDLKKLEFINTTFTPFSINGVTELNKNIFVATDSNIYYIPISDQNPADFGRWKKMSSDFGLKEKYSAQHITTFNNQIFVNINDTIYVGNGNDNFEIKFIAEQGFDINFLSPGQQYLIIGNRNFSNNRSKIVYFDKNLNLTSGNQTCLSRLRFALEDNKGKIWFADEWSPFKYSDKITDGCQTFDYNSPLGNQSGEIHFKGETVFLAGGGITEDYQNPSGSYGFYKYEDKVWTNYLSDNFPEIGLYEMAYIQTVIPNQKNNEIVIGSHWNGFMKWDIKEGTVEHYNKDNTNRILLPRVGDTLRTRIPFMVYDNAQNLWICNYGAPKPLVVLTKDGEWQNFSLGGNINAAKIAVDKNNNKWISIQGVSNGLAVFNEGDDIFDISDDKFRYFTSANSEIEANKVHTVFTDLNGSVWVGTSEGPVIFDCPDPFSSNCTGSTRKVIEDGIPAILLKTEEILSIVTDGANRKWLGTKNGIFVLSPAGDTLITKYDTKNSPLLDNTIRYLAFNGISGEMWISSNKGIQSFRTTTTSGGKTHGEVQVFPNPVRPEYDGLIGIKGLLRDANVKITDISGRLVFETTAEGGQAVWNARDYTGSRVKSGVYLVFSTSQEIVDSPDTLVTKILIMN